MHPGQVTGAHTRGDRHKAAHHIRSEDSVLARPVPKETLENPHQPGRQKIRPELAIPTQTNYSTPRKGRIYDSDAGRVLLLALHDDWSQVLVAKGPTDQRAVHRIPQEDHYVRGTRKGQQAVLSGVRTF